MPRVVVYCTHMCPYCRMAIHLLENKGVEFERIQVDEQPDQRVEMRRLTGRTTVPQIFIGNVHIGGYVELAGLDMQGRLDNLLGQ